MTDKELERGRIAASLLENEIYQEAYNVVRNAYLEAFANSPVRDVDGQHEIRLMLKAMQDVRTHIEQVLNTGKMAELKLKEEKTLWNRIVGR